MNTTEIIESLEARRKRIRSYYLLYIAVCLVAIALFFIQKSLMVTVAGVAVIGYFVLLRPALKRLRKQFSHDNLVVSMSTMLNEVEHNPKGGISTKVISEAKLVPIKLEKGFISREYATGSKSGLQVEFADISSHYMLLQQGKNKPVWVTGAWTHITLPAGTGQNIRVIHKSLLEEGIARKQYEFKQGLKQIRTGKEKIDEMFLVFSTGDGVDARLLKLLLELQEYTTGAIGFSLIGGDMNLFINNRFLTFNGVAMAQPMKRETLELCAFPEMRNILDIARACEQI